MRDMGVEKGNSYSGGPQKYAYRLTNVNHMAATSSLKNSPYWTNASKRSRGFMSVHALDGLTSYYTPHKEDNTKVFTKPLQYTFNKSLLNDTQALASTKAFGISQTPQNLNDYKRIVFDFRGTPIVHIMENDFEVKAPPKQINGPSIKNVS
jgi:hypothetical protein